MQDCLNYYYYNFVCNWSYCSKISY